MTSTTTAGSSSPTAKSAVSLGRLLTFLLPATTALYGVFQGIQQILLPAQVAAIAPDDKVSTLAVLTTLAAVASLVALPTGGALSDRTLTRFGRRTPWIVIMSAVSALLMLVMGVTTSLVVLAVVYMALWFTANFFSGAISAILPDRVPEERRGIASAVIGLGTPIGILYAVNVASRVSQFWGYATIAIVFVAASLLLVFCAPEGSSRHLTRPQRQKVSARHMVAAFFAAFSSRDFTLAFISRFALFMSYFVVSGYLFYTLQDYVGVENLPGGNLAVAVSTLSSISVLTWMVVATIAGWLADKVDRRKAFVGVSALLLGASMVIPILSPTWTGMVVYSALSGAFVGIYFAVDLAVMSLVLPDKANEGRDFGILAVATGLPQILSSVIAGILITALGGYTSLYIFGGVCALISGAVMMRVRSVR